MEIFRGIQQLAQAQRPLRHPVVTIGNFDGVHLGHQEIVRTAVEQARARGGEAVAYTFRPHPQLALKPDVPVRLLSTYDEKLELLGRCGLDVVVEEPFGREFSEMPPELFFTDVILRRLGAEAIVVGYDFAFGKGRGGNLQVLEGFCKNAGIAFTVVSPVKVGNEVASSSRIRSHLITGELGEANRLLGRPFIYRGVVLRGDGRGHQIGFATANLKLEEKLAIPLGVYATRSVIGPASATAPMAYPSVTNVGVRPTFGGQGGVLIETHILDFDQDLYGKALEVQFIEKLRDERKFSGIDELKAQIASDVGTARAKLSRPA